MIDFNNLAAGLDNIDPVLLKAQTTRVYETCHDEGYAAGRLGHPCTPPPYRDPEMTAGWLDGYNNGKARRVDQRIPADTVCA